MVCFIGTRKKKRNVMKRILPLRKAKFNARGYNSDKLIKYYSNKIMMLLPNLFIRNNYEDIIYFHKENKIVIPNNSILHDIFSYSIIYEYTIIKVCVGYDDDDGHISIMIVDNKNKIIEWFDTAPPNKIEKTKLLEKIKYYLPSYKITIVNNKHHIQKSNYDVYCQTWIYYFIYKRIHKKKQPAQIINNLMKYNRENRVDIVRKFFYKLIY